MQQPQVQSTSKTAILWHGGNDLNESVLKEPGLNGPAENALDDPLNALVITLHEQQYQTVSFTECTQVAEAVVAHDADLLLIDLPTVGLQSYDLCKTLRRQLATQYLPIVFVSANANRQERLEALRCGSSEYLPLPISAEEYWLSLRPHLESYQRVRQLQTERLNLSAKVGHYGQLLAQQEQLKAVLTEENQALQKIAFVDGLTQVGNRRQFDYSVARMWESAYQQHRPLSLIMCDVDYFKRYNDTYGHLAGDDCLRSVAIALVEGAQRCIERCIEQGVEKNVGQNVEQGMEQNGVQVARYGGEEFAILLPATNHKKAQQVARSIQSAVTGKQIPHRTSLVKPQVSISVGVHTLIPSYRAQPYERLIYGADKALYAAKLRGRDRIVATTLPEKSADRLLEPVPKPFASEYSSRLEVRGARFSTRLSGHVA